MIQSKRTYFLLIAPAIILLALYAAYPVLRTLMLAFFQKNMDSNFSTNFIGLGNFIAVFNDSHYWSVIWNTFQLTIACTLLEAILGLSFALLAHRHFAMKGAFRTALLIPWALPTAVMALGWSWIFKDTGGVLNDILIRLNIVSSEVNWLGSPATALISIVIADVWKTTPFVYIIILAGLQTIPESVYEAAEIDGATKLHAFKRITIPLLKPYIIIALFFRSIQTFGIFDLVFILTGGGPGGSTETIALYIYQTYMRYMDIGYGSALIVITFIMVAVPFLLFYLFFVQIKKKV
jgi:multiple sugar transport system permease protein